MNTKAIAGALRSLAIAFEEPEDAPAPRVEDAPAYYTRRKSPLSARAWDRMVASREVETFRPGKEIMARVDDVHAWIEAHPDTRETPARSVEGAVPIPYDAFKRAALRRRKAS